MSVHEVYKLATRLQLDLTEKLHLTATDLRSELQSR
jgi:hypothetical protein